MLLHTGNFRQKSRSQQTDTRVFLSCVAFPSLLIIQSIDLSKKKVFHIYLSHPSLLMHSLVMQSAAARRPRASKRVKHCILLVHLVSHSVSSEIQDVIGMAQISCPDTQEGSHREGAHINPGLMEAARHQLPFFASFRCFFHGAF